MKKIFMTIVAVAAIAACSKTEVQYENSAEIGFAPAVKNVTKGAMTGVLATVNPDQKLGIWAYWNYKNGNVTDSYDELYLNNATFKNKTVTYNDGSNDVTTSAFWAGENYAYPWPLNGKLRFAGYTIPTGQNNDFEVSYSGVADDIVTFANYTQQDGFDLCWFGATEATNKKNEADPAVSVTLSHALSWLSFYVKGDGTEGWKINSMVINDIASVGTGHCTGSGAGAAAWSFASNAYTTKMPLALVADLKLTNTLQNVEGENVNNILVLPQTINAGGQAENARTQHTLTINYSFPVGNPDVATNWKSESKTVNLDLTGTDIDNKWKSGFKYTYNLTFKSNEILVSPTYGGWDTMINQGVTIE